MSIKKQRIILYIPILNLLNAFFNRNSPEMQKKLQLKKLESEIWKLTGHEFNIASPKQLGIVLFDELGLKLSALDFYYKKYLILCSLCKTSYIYLFSV